MIHSPFEKVTLDKFLCWADRDIEYALNQFAEDVFFQDMMFSDPFIGKAQLKAHFEK
jgi:hypothetical protein